MSGKQRGNLSSKPTTRGARAKEEGDGGAVGGARDNSSVVDTLPVELLLHVFEHLDTKTLMVVVPGVCRRWRAVCGDTPRVCADLSFLPRSLRMAPPPGARQLRPSSPLLGLSSALSRFKYVETVLMPYGQDGIAYAIANSCPRLSVVDFTDHTSSDGNVLNFSDIGLIALAEHCPQLTCVDIRMGVFTDAALVTLTRHCPRLTSLAVGSRGGISNTGVRVISERFGPQLTSVHFSSSDLGDDAIIAVAERCPHLSVVGFPQSAITGTGLAVLAQHCPFLTSIDCARCELLTDVDIAAFLQHYPLLTRVDIADCEQLTDLAVVTLAEKCKLLAHIDVTGCGELTDKSLIALGKHCPELMTVDFSQCFLVTDVGVMAVARGCPLLTYVDFSDCPLVTDAGVIELAEHCSQLKFLFLYGCGGLTDASVDALAEHCVRLEMVNLTESPQITHVLWPVCSDEWSEARSAARGFISVMSIC